MGQARRRREQERAEVATGIGNLKRSGEPWTGGCCHCDAVMAASLIHTGDGLAAVTVDHSDGCDRASYHDGDCSPSCIGDDLVKLRRFAPVLDEAGIDPGVFLAAARQRASD